MDDKMQAMVDDVVGQAIKKKVKWLKAAWALTDPQCQHRFYIIPNGRPVITVDNAKNQIIVTSRDAVACYLTDEIAEEASLATLNHLGEQLGGLGGPDKT